MEPSGSSPERPPLSGRAVITALVAVAALAVVLALRSHREVSILEERLERAAGDNARLEARLAELEAQVTRPPQPVDPDPPRPAFKATASGPVTVRVAPAAPAVRVADPGRLRRGAEAFRAGRYAEAQVHFYRALPQGHVPLVLASLARGDLENALHHLRRAMAEDPEWLRREWPVFGEGELERIVTGLEGADPLDAEAKLLLAFVVHRTRGAAPAEALLRQARSLSSDLEGVGPFLEALEE